MATARKNTIWTHIGTKRDDLAVVEASRVGFMGVDFK